MVVLDVVVVVLVVVESLWCALDCTNMMLVRYEC